MTETPERGQDLGEVPERGIEEPEEYLREEQGADERGLQDPDADDGEGDA